MEVSSEASEVAESAADSASEVAESAADSWVASSSDQAPPSPESQVSEAEVDAETETSASNAVEASTKLAKFLPNRSTPEHLRVLLEARADPNVIRGVGSPLDVVITLAKEEHVPIVKDKQDPRVSHVALHWPLAPVFFVVI